MTLPLPLNDFLLYCSAVCEGDTLGYLLIARALLVLWMLLLSVQMLIVVAFLGNAL